MDFSIKRRDREREREPERDRNGDSNRELRRRDGDDRPAQKKHRHDGERDRDRNGESASAGRRRLTGPIAVQRAKQHLIELTGRRAEAVSALQRTRDGWRIVLEIVELERIPQTTDILASYAVDLDSEGELMGYQRVARYYRSDVTE